MKEIENFIRKLSGKPVAVFGLARSGLATIRALKEAGANVVAWDDNHVAREKAQKLGADVHILTQRNLRECAMLILAPGVPLHFPEPHPVVIAAHNAHLEIICDIELFHRMGYKRFTVGITGTNGKSTTTALVQHILKSSGMNAVMGGNIGLPVFDLPIPADNGVFVFELSSYQLDLCPTFRPDIAVLMNITPDHLDRHGTIENYARIKEHIFEGQGTAVIGTDDELSAAICRRVQAKGERKVIPVSVKDKKLQDKLQGRALKGVHNYQNALVAYHVCREMNVPDEKIFAAIQTFPGLPHRQFPVRTINGVTYINDSKATNAESTSKALVSYENIDWIVGGRPKEGGLNGLEPLMHHVRKAYLIGESMKDFMIWMVKNKVAFEECATMDAAVAAAHKQAENNGVVLLSPACASFDQFTSYEHRGDVFTKLVNELPGEV